ncbi:MAG: hypothetical protein IJ158_14525 [Treponema sp.]|nr:hypothetical protein [Treponema sp.]
MKKIVSAALVGAMVASAFAADAKITLNYRTKLDAFSARKVEVGDTTTHVKEWLDWEGYTGAGKQTPTNAADSFKFVLNGENAGATLNLNVNANTATQGFTLVEYSAWMGWALGPGKLTLRSGNWKDGYADGAYRVKKDADAGNAEGLDFELNKLGTILKGTNKLDFIDDLAKGGNQNALFSEADYGFTVGDGVNLNVLLGSVYNAFDTVKDADDPKDTTTTYYDAFFVSRLQLKMDPLNAELIYKLPAPKTHDIALYFMPKILDTLTLNVGGALEMYTADKEKGGYTDWAFDLRARFQATDALSLTLFTNISGTNLENAKGEKVGRNVSKGVAGRDGKYGWVAGGANLGGANAKVTSAMWNNLSARLKISDLLTATLNVGLVTPLGKVDNDDNKYGPEWRVVPAVQIYASSNASIWAGIALSGNSVTIKSAAGDVDGSSFNFDIPVIFRVKM